MKGKLLIEFITMVRQRFGNAMADTLIQQSHLADAKQYNANRNYSDADLPQLVHTLAEQTQLAEQDILRIYGEHLYAYFSKLNPEFFAILSETLHSLAHSGVHLHIEAKQTSPAQSLPAYDDKGNLVRQLNIIYQSDLSLGTIASGLLQGLLKPFGSQMTLSNMHTEHMHTTYAHLNAEPAPPQ